MADIRSIEDIARKWATVTPQRSADYEAGVREPKTDWAAASAASNEAWKAGVQAAIAGNRFTGGVAQAGTPKWQRGALEKGVSRWGPGVALAEDDYRQAFAPFVDAIRRTKLPPRFARRDPRNLQRVTAVVEALVKVKAGASTR